MATKSNSLTVNPSGYDSSKSSYTANSSYPITNAYTNTSSTSYFYMQLGTTSAAESYVYLTFDLSSIPSNATIGAVNCNIKYSVSSTSYVASSSIQLYNGTTAMGSATTTRSTTSSTLSLTCGTWTRSQLDNLFLRVYCQRSTSSTTRAAGSRIYGAELTIDYTWEDVTYTLTTTITGGKVTSSNPVILGAGENSTITFTKDETDYELKSMTVNGVEVTPTWIEGSSDSCKLTASTNTTEYTTDSNGISAICDGDSSTYYWTNQSQAVGQYMMITCSTPIYLKGVSSVCTKSSSDYFKSNVDLQISSNGTDWTTIGTCADNSSQSFTGINQICQYVRFYVTTAASNWWCVNEITLDYDTVASHYEYTVSDISANTDVIVIFGTSGPHLYRKVGDTWKLVKTIYRKTADGWTTMTAEDFNTFAAGKKFNMLDMPLSAVGNVTKSTNAINLTDSTLAADTYTLYYEDSDGNKLTDWDAIGTITKS